MTEPQIWMQLGIFASAFFAMLAVISSWFVRVLRAEVGAVRAEVAGLRSEMNAKFEGVDAQFERVDVKLDHLDRDVQAIARRVFPERD